MSLNYRVGWVIGILVLLGQCMASGAPQTATLSPPKVSGDQAEFFEQRIRPLLVSSCYSCHGDSLQMGGLRLDSRTALLKGGVTGPGATLADPAGSLILTAVHYDGKLKMPPSGKLSASQIADLTRWIALGAPWPSSSAMSKGAATPAAKAPTFWSFRPVKTTPPPAVKNRAWVKSPLDSFILADLEKKGLRPALPADKATLLRRVTFDLTGLPPTPGEMQAFLTDTSPNAYAKVIDRLLASPRYGERWGRHWLDVVRYADSQDARGLGGEGDISEAWRYRNWVVDAFNRDLPYNRFVITQIAGDLLPPPPGHDLNADGITATGLLAIGDWGNGDADKEKLVTDIVDDQVDVVSRTFMGLTVACARCHDHKFDPIPTRDYYGLAGIFFSSHILPKLTPKGAGETPLRIALTGKQEQARRESWQQRTMALEQQLKTARDTSRTALAKQLLPETSRYVAATWEYTIRPESQASLGLTDWAKKRSLYPYALRQWSAYLGLGEYRPLSTPIRDLAGMAGVHALKDGAGSDTPSVVVNTNAAARTLLTFTLPPHSVTIHPAPQSGAGVGWRSPVTGDVQITGRVADADPGGGDGIAWALDLRSQAQVRQIAGGQFENGGAQDFVAGASQGTTLDTVTVRAGDTLQLLVLPKQSHSFDTTVVEWTITDKRSKRVWNLAREVIRDWRKQSSNTTGVWSFYDLAGSRRSADADGTETSVARWHRAVVSATTSRDGLQASDSFARTFDFADARSPFWINAPDDETALPAVARASIAALTKAQDTLRRTPPPPLGFANGAQEGGIPGTAYEGIHDAAVHIRGSYARLGETVPRHFPAVLLTGGKQPAIPARQSGRLELARWIASDTHPLTARVMVNRLWQHHFGQGLVRTPSNFGALGERPTHPALLDWLALQFVKNGWSVKQMHRLILLSATYQQSSIGNAQVLKTDPDNRLWGRMNRRRLEAEALRDSLLSVSGELHPEEKGPATRDFSTPCRSLYVMTIRSERTGFGPLFDTPNASASVDARAVSTVAPQALFLLNNPFTLDRTRVFARRAIKETPRAESKTRIQHVYQLVYGRAPSQEELRIGLAFLKHAGSPPAGELTPWEQYCQILLCANEFIYVD